MNTEVGKKYTTRGGGIAAITNELAPDPFTGKVPEFRFVGYIKGLDRVLVFAPSGKYSEISDSPNDLISEYIEPPTCQDVCKQLTQLPWASVNITELEKLRDAARKALAAERS